MKRRGKIRNRARAQQIVDMTGLRFGSITPTDIDLSMDFEHGAYWVQGELKLKDTRVDDGQMEHLTHKIRILHTGSDGALGFIADHEAWDTAADIDAGAAIVRLHWWPGERQWRAPVKTITVRKLIDDARTFWGLVAPVVGPTVRDVPVDVGQGMEEFIEQVLAASPGEPW